MIKDLINGDHLAAFPALALVMFFFVLVLSCLWVFRPGSQRIYRSLSALPLDKPE